MQASRQSVSVTDSQMYFTVAIANFNVRNNLDLTKHGKMQQEVIEHFCQRHFHSRI